MNEYLEWARLVRDRGAMSYPRSLPKENKEWLTHSFTVFTSTHIASSFLGAFWIEVGCRYYLYRHRKPWIGLRIFSHPTTPI